MKYINQLENQNKQLKILVGVLYFACGFMFCFQMMLAFNTSDARAELKSAGDAHKIELKNKDKKIKELKATIESLEKENEILSDMRPVHGVVSEY